MSAEPSAAKPASAYPSPALQPTQEGPRGLRFDFNEGARLTLPEAEADWQVRLTDLDTHNILFETSLKAGFVNSTKRYYVRYRIEVSQAGQEVLAHEMDLRDRPVLILFPIGTLGDTMGWFPYAARFQRLHRCRLTVGMAERLIPLFRDAYPHIAFLTHEQVRAEAFYATYYAGLFFDDDDHVWQPSDFRLVGLHRTMGHILGVDPTEEPPLLGVPDEGRPMAEPYVCIAVQSSTQAKNWTNPFGWREVVAFLRAAGFQVVCIDQSPVHGHGLVWNHIPHGVRDETGDRPLAERVRWLRHAAFFVGLSSGLSWLAWAARVPVVMVSGFTHPSNEFQTPYRIFNHHACNSCWNDVRVRFRHDDYLWCPRHAGTPRQFECTRLITAGQVIDAIRRVPEFGAQAG